MRHCRATDACGGAVARVGEGDLPPSAGGVLGVSEAGTTAGEEVGEAETAVYSQLPPEQPVASSTKAATAINLCTAES
jgi:hypothetical protein